MDVESRREEDVDTIFEHLVADGLTDLFDEFGIPRRREHRTDGEVGAVIGGCVVVACRADAQAGGAVGKHDCGNAETGYRVSRAGGTGNNRPGLADDGAVAAVDAGHAGADDKVGFLFEGHGVHDLVDIVLVKLGC